MKFLIETAALKAALEKLRGGIQARNTIPILSNVKIEAHNGNLTLTTTNLDMVLTETVADVTVEREGGTTTNFSLLSEAVRKLPKGSQISVNEVDGAIACNVGRINFEIYTLPIADFPMMNMDAPVFEFTVLASQLATAFEMSDYCHATEETRYYLNGTQLVSHDGNVEFVATSGHVLAKYDLEHPEMSIGDKVPSIILHYATTAEVMKMCANAKEIDTVTVRGTEAKVSFEIGNTFMMSKLVDGTFPDYHRVIPKHNELTLKADRKVLRAAVDRVMTFSGIQKGVEGLSRTVVMSLEGDELKLSGQVAEGGKGDETLMVDWDGGKTRIGVNGYYLMGHLDAIATRDVEIKISSTSPGSSPSLIMGIDPDNAHLGVLMPLRA